MGRTSASPEASGGDERRASERPSNAAPYRRPAGANEDGAPTARNLIPWRDMEKKLAERLAAKAAAGELSGAVEKEPLGASSKPPPWKSDVELAPDSGVRSSAESPPPRELTYSVYTVADLEARGQARPPRMSMAFAPALPAPPSRWAETGTTAIALLRVCWGHLRTPKPRPRMLDACRVPLQLFLTELKLSVRSLPWKKLVVGAGIALGTLLVLLLVVLTAAELTDDLNPARSSSATTAGKGVSLSLSTATAASKNEVALPAEAPRAPEPEPAPSIEIDDEDAPAAVSAKPAPKPKPKKPLTKKKGVELFKP
jgi:hypothetical protein